MLTASRRIVFCVAAAAIVIPVSSYCLSVCESQDRAADKKPAIKVDQAISTFMRKKLEMSNQVLEGIVTEDAALIRKGAEALGEMSKAEKWMVSNDVMYRQSNGEFQRSVEKLVEAAKKENFDQAALNWIDTTMKCIECHKFVRGTRLAR